ANALVEVGDPTNSCATIFENQPRLTMQLDPFSTATFADDNGAIFEFVQTEVATFADANGSFVSVTPAQVGLGVNTVVARNFFVVPNSGGVLVNPTIWEQSGGFSKSWRSEEHTSE